jgi:hypothetical protein
MNNYDIIDTSFLALKVATLNDEKAKIIVEGASALYNATQVVRLKTLITQYSQTAGSLLSIVESRGYYTPEEYNLFVTCQQQIKECNEQLGKHGLMTVIDSVALMLDLFEKFSKQR